MALTEFLPPTTAALIISTIAQMLIWGVLYHSNGPIRRPLRRWIEASPTRLQHIETNHVHLGCTALSPVNYVTFGHTVLVHHGLGALFAGAGCVCGSASLTRLGLSFEIGEDLLHYVEMAYSFARPPGTELFGELYPKKLFWLCVALHHILGLLAGSFAFLHACDWAEVQLLVVLLLGLTLPGLLSFTLLPHGDVGAAGAVGRACLLLTLANMALNFYGRFVAFVPIAWRLVGAGARSKAGPTSPLVVPVPRRWAARPACGQGHHRATPAPPPAPSPEPPPPARAASICRHAPRPRGRRLRRCQRVGGGHAAAPLLRLLGALHAVRARRAARRHQEAAAAARARARVAAEVAPARLLDARGDRAAGAGGRAGGAAGAGGAAARLELLLARRAQPVGRPRRHRAPEGGAPRDAARGGTAADAAESHSEGGGWERRIDLAL